MKLLLDTHVLIWSAGTPEKLSQRVRDLLTDTSNTFVLSIVSVWEMQIKIQLGKLRLNSSLPKLIESQQQTNNLQLLPMELAHIWTLANLLDHHRDPFDRLLIAQSIVEQMPILSVDSAFDAYRIHRLW